MSIATKLGALLEEAYIPGSRAVLDDVVSGLRHGEAVRWIATAMPWRLPSMTWTAPSLSSLPRSVNLTATGTRPIPQLWLHRGERRALL